MRKNMTATVLLTILVNVAGCDLILDRLWNSGVHVRLLNNSDYPVKVTLYYSDQTDLPRDVLTTLGTKVEYTIPAQDSADLSKPCGELRSLVIDKAELLVVGSVGPEAEMEVLRRGTDFECLETLTFTFDHGPTIVDFNIDYQHQ